MANDDFPSGLKPIRHLNGYDITCQPYRKDASSGIIGKGDAVILQSDGFIDNAAADPNGIYLGVAAESAATAVAATVNVYTDENIVYKIQADASIAETARGNAALLITTAANATLGLSKYEIDASSIATAGTATKVFNIIGVFDGFNSDGTKNTWGSFADLEVVFNKTLNKAQSPAV